MSAPPRVLIVDDNALNLELAQVVLSGAGFTVQTAADADAAWPLLLDWRPDLVLMDIQLPGTDGLGLTRRIKAEPALAGVVVVAFTAYAMQGDRARLLAAGCDGYLSKPIDVKRFAEQVRALLPAR